MEPAYHQLEFDLRVYLTYKEHFGSLWSIVCICDEVCYTIQMNTSNIHIVCPHCLEIREIEKNDATLSQKCTKCAETLLDAKPITANKTILEYFIKNSDLPLVVDFWAHWCGPCISMAPHFEKAAFAMPLEAQFLKINNDNEETLGAQFLIKNIPAVLILKEGKEIARFTGMRSSKQIEKWVREYI